MAERALSKGTGKSLTTRRWRRPKSCMARAAAPMLLGLRARTRTMWMQSSSSGVGIEFYCKVVAGAAV